MPDGINPFASMSASIGLPPAPGFVTKPSPPLLSSANAPPPASVVGGRWRGPKSEVVNVPSHAHGAPHTSLACRQASFNPFLRHHPSVPLRMKRLSFQPSPRLLLLLCCPTLPKKPRSSTEKNEIPLCVFRAEACTLRSPTKGLERVRHLSDESGIEGFR